MQWLTRILHKLAEGPLQPDRLEYALALHSALFGFWLLLPGETFTSTPAWTILVAMGLHENVLGLLLFLLGIAKLVAIRHWGTRPRRILNGLALITWAMITGSFAFSSLSGTGVPTYGLVAAGWFVLYAGIDWTRPRQV